jgi:hypothetical protein
MATGINLSRWSALLLEEIFRDRDGHGRPVSTIDAGGALLARAMAHSGVQVSDDEALKTFFAAFPDRWQALRWFSGVDSPSEALLAFLIVCCIAASDSAGSEANDYRERLRQMMGWDGIISCAALPGLWRRLEASLVSAPADQRLRKLILPDPRHRTQIGHAIELTFPSQQDARRLRRDLDEAAALDADSPVAVLRWLAPRLSRYSSTFAETFHDFQSAWLSGHRSLKDHRFWSGWSMVLDTRRPRQSSIPFNIIIDEWGRHQLLTKEQEALELRSIERDAAAPVALKGLLTAGTPILLRELEWGVWTWCGPGRSAARDAGGALVREKSHSANFISRLGLTPVAGASGWGFTRAVDLLPGTAGRLAVSDDDLIDIIVSGVPRVEGGWLARPSFPIIVSTTGPVGAITLSGSLAPDLVISRQGAQCWTITPTKALQGEVTVSVESYAAGEGIVRRLTLRRAVIAPSLERDVPSRFAVDERAVPPWTASRTNSAGSASFALRRSMEHKRPNQGLLDLIEHLAARAGPTPLGGLLDLIGSIDHGVAAGGWSIIRALFEAGALEPLRIRGWRGSAVMPRAPRAIICRVPDGHRLLIDGLVSEALIARATGMADRQGLQSSLVEAASDWAPSNVIVHGPDEGMLSSLATDLALPVEWLATDLSGLSSPITATPDGDGGTHAHRQQIQTPDLKPLERAGVRLFLCRREADDARRVWLVQGPEGQERFWTHRHNAILDACRIGRLKPFMVDGAVLRLTQPGAFLPLAVARWIRVATGASSGPTDAGYVYALTPTIEAAISAFLGPLLLKPVPFVGDLGLPRRVRGPALATAVGSSVATTEVWRWARGPRGEPTHD